MAAPRLSDAQKQELVSRFQAGSNTQELAESFGCSPNTVIRVVKAAIAPSDYEELKRQRSRRSPPPQGGVEATADTASPPPPSEDDPLPPIAVADAPEEPAATPEGPLDDADAESSRGEPEENARGLAIDDADDFDELDGEGEDEGEDDPDGMESTFVEVPVSLVDGLDQTVVSARPWKGEEMPSCAFMLVDKTVELQARPLGEISELGRVAPEELELQALVLYGNPRQAKRQCGRTQRVIKVPDLGVFERTASYLQRQGIRRVVVEGALYALPEP
ncbi:MAG: hypothetical protein ACKO0M_06730 [Cyanobium sp.]